MFVCSYYASAQPDVKTFAFIKTFPEQNAVTKLDLTLGPDTETNLLLI